MSTHVLPPIPYPPIERHGVIGDRRSAALVAADGTLDWLCLPDYGDDIIFGAILDRDKGGFWRLGPAQPTLGAQLYREHTATLLTTWEDGDSLLELADTMARPEQATAGRAIFRHLSCKRGHFRCAFDLCPRWNFAPGSWKSSATGRVLFWAGPVTLQLWETHLLQMSDRGGQAILDLHKGEEYWAVLEMAGEHEEWSIARAQEAVRQAEDYWRSWAEHLTYSGTRQHLRRSGLMVHLLSYGPAGSAIAAPTTSLPQRIGADWNADYRFVWIRDASLALGVLALLGCTRDGGRYLEWLARLGSSAQSPFQVMYGVRGETDLAPKERKDIYGYRGSRPVCFGNHAYKQHQHDSLGYLADCILLHLQNGGHWRPAFWDLVHRLTDHILAHWQEPGNGIWELPVEQHYLSGKVMSWVALDRAIKIAEKLGHSRGVERWRSVRDEIHAEVMEKGWSDRLGAFRQRYEADNLDAAALLITVMDFLPADHPRVRATVERIAEVLTLGGFVYRFVPRETPGLGDLPLGEYEGAFLPCTFWLATAYAKMGQPDLAESILRRAEASAGPLGIFAEGVDPRSGSFLGNSPLLFSHTEYVRAALEVDRAQEGRPIL